MIHSKFIHHSQDLCGAHFFDLQVLKERKRAHQSSQSMPNLPNFKKDETLLTVTNFIQVVQTVQENFHFHSNESGQQMATTATETKTIRAMSRGHRP